MPTKEDDIEMISNPLRWPGFPFLAMRKPSKADPYPFDFECGIIYAYDYVHSMVLQFPLKVRVTNLYNFQSIEQFLNMPVEEFQSFEEMFAAGWRVD